MSYILFSFLCCIHFFSFKDPLTTLFQNLYQGYGLLKSSANDDPRLLFDLTSFALLSNKPYTCGSCKRPFLASKPAITTIMFNFLSREVIMCGV